MEPLIHSAAANDGEDNVEENIDEFPHPTGNGIDGDGDVGHSKWFQTIHRVQRISLLASPVVAGLALIVVGVWIAKLGGLSTQPQGQAKLVFNWHPLFMILSFLFMTVATLSFRFSPLLLPTRLQIPRPVAKLGHGLCWAMAAFCMILGLVAVFHSHNDPVSGFIANLYSLHSWIGIMIVLLYFGQLLAGLSAFGIPFSLGMPPTMKFILMQIHTFLGPVIYQGVIVTILLGIQEKEGYVGCAYKVDHADLRPWQHWQDIPPVCRISHGLGFLIVTTGLLTVLATHNFERTDHRRHR